MNEPFFHKPTRFIYYVVHTVLYQVTPLRDDGDFSPFALFSEERKGCLRYAHRKPDRLLRSSERKCLGRFSPRLVIALRDALRP